MISYFVVLFVILILFQSESLDDACSFGARFLGMLESTVLSIQKYRVIDVLLILILLLTCRENQRINIMTCIRPTCRPNDKSVTRQLNNIVSADCARFIEIRYLAAPVS